MTPSIKRAAFFSAVLATAISAASAQQLDTDTRYAQLLDLAREIESLRNSGGNPLKIAELVGYYEAVSESLGGDQAPGFNSASGTQAVNSSLQGALSVVAPLCSGSSPTTTSFSGTTGAIPDFATGVPVPTNFAATVAGQGSYLWDVNLTTAILHTNCADIDMTLKSPAGTIVVITTDNGLTNDNVFNGTVWDDNVNTPCVDFVYVNGVAAASLSPEGRLEAFRGENPNGAWTLTITDDTQGSSGGTLSSWSLSVSSLAAAPVTSSSTISRTPNLAILDVATVFDTMPVAALGTYLQKVVLFTQITHTFAADMDITLTSAAGTVVAITTDNGAGFNDVFNGTTFDGDTLDTVTDHVYQDLVVATPLSPEGAFDNFLGQNPNGNWVLTITDDLGADTGNLARWDLTFTTTTAPSPSAPVSVSGAAGPFLDPQPPTPPNFTASVSGLGSYLWDVDLTTAIQHTSNGDLDITLRSPANTTVVISTDNGGTFDDVFNGTLWDDNSNNPATDNGYADLTASTPLSPEGRLVAFRGENPNGVWTLTINDDTTGNAGTLNSWSLGVTTLTSAPTEVTTTTSRSPALAILDVSTVSDVMAVSGSGTSISKVVLYTEITHTFAADMDITLSSPLGTTVTITTDNGGAFNDVYNGTTFDPDVLDTVTDHVYADFTIATPLSPEGSFDNFAGQNPNGAWTLTITDDLGADTGELVRWDLTITTCNGVSLPTTYCTPGTTTNGCTANISASSNPSVSGATACVITVSDVEGQKNGIIFYGQLANAIPWGAGSTATLCVKAPTQRMAALTSGGILGQCNGLLVQNWDTWQAANPTALGNPWVVGEKAYVQGWFRDPPQPKTTNLSDGIEMTYLP